ncbi:hypothetical protein GUITHDRAFT_131559 [Guillardia theta CCMP2712]|uniref:Uncharacterized protein n=1 Tax=Guillardia theta (strain CCMP2712) TaxID=905079 RepID=L1K4R9_GUITC|nr:hypothetical protein GUITHDRAFT_131559 [Guillardia theta CCMP2712]EKX55338.1 hypothetical protein GUITHDRAFT_131559 [Guillardia theta CCMP2712]|eukprot:XP_005842318.1 hypothetical protein GUITHDRAFT_131559 [Guillardia theta CCMP2712]
MVDFVEELRGIMCSSSLVNDLDKSVLEKCECGCSYDHFKDYCCNKGFEVIGDDTQYKRYFSQCKENAEKVGDQDAREGQDSQALYRGDGELSSSCAEAEWLSRDVMRARGRVEWDNLRHRNRGHYTIAVLIHTDMHEPLLGVLKGYDVLRDHIHGHIHDGEFDIFIEIIILIGFFHIFVFG